MCRITPTLFISCSSEASLAVASKGKGYIFRVEARSDAETSGHQREELYLRSDTEAERDEWLAAIDAAWIGQHGSTALIVAAQHNDVPAVPRRPARRLQSVFPGM